MSRRADDGRTSIVIYTNSPYKGGAEMTLGEVLAELPDRFDVTVAGVEPSVVEWLAGCRPSARVELLPVIKGRNDLGSMLATARAFRRLAPDILHFNLGMVSASQWAIFIAVLKGRAKTLAVENSPVDAWTPSSERLKRFTSPRLSAHVAVGDATARTVEKIAKLKPGSVGTLYHGVRDVARDVPREPHDGPVLLNIARHQKVKGVDVLLHAMTHLPSDVKLVQIGSGEEFDQMVALRDELGLGDRVEFRDVSWDERAADLIAGFDVYVLPSRNEGLPVSVMEAMLAGVGIVATDVGGLREELTDGETGRIVPSEDPVALAKAIDELLSDPVRRAEMGRRAREDALERFTVEATVTRYCDLYDRLTGRGTGD